MQWIDDATVEQRQNYIATTQAVTQYLQGMPFVGRQNEIAWLPGLNKGSVCVIMYAPFCFVNLYKFAHMPCAV